MRNVVSLPAGLQSLSVKFAQFFASLKWANTSAILPRFSGCHFLVSNLHQCGFQILYFCPRGWSSILAFTIGNSRCQSRWSNRLSPILSWPVGAKSSYVHCVLPLFLSKPLLVLHLQPQTNPALSADRPRPFLLASYLLVTLSFVN